MAVNERVITTISVVLAREIRRGPSNKAVVESVLDDLYAAAHGQNKVLENAVRRIKTTIKSINEGD